jgi:hypothetical protein
MQDIVPHQIKLYWATQLAAKDRPGWATEKLRDHFWPVPTYRGKMPGDTAEEKTSCNESDKDIKVEKDVKGYIAQLRSHVKDSNRMINYITKETILEAFDIADGSDPPGIRLQWEYLICEGYDRDFYDTLVQVQNRYISKHPNEQ